MHLSRQTRNTWLFLGLLLLAGFANLFSKTGNAAFDTLMCCINYLTYLGLLLYWIGSVRIRLLPSSTRNGVIFAGLLLLLFMLLRIFAYKFAVSAAAQRYAIYGYWIPQMLIPAVFLMTCIRIRRVRQDSRKWNEYLLLIPAALLALMAITNDLHFLVYKPFGDLSTFTVEADTYSYGPGFYMMYAWMALTCVGFIFFFHEAGRIQKKAVLFLIGDIAIWLGNVLFDTLILFRYSRYRFFNIPETHIFCMLGILEICIRYRLIPSNENYSGFFQNLQIPAVITDRNFQIVTASKDTPSIGQEMMQKALLEPVYLTPDLKLSGKEIKAGYAFWAEDESTIHRAQEKLLDANEMIEHENDLILAETKQKEQDAYLRSRHRIYHEIAEELYPCQQKITNLLGTAIPGTSDFKEKIAFVSVLNAYVKRKTNLLLLASENEALSITELFLALQESANYLTLAGLKTTAGEPSDDNLASSIIVALYDAFEAIAEQFLGKVPSLMVSLSNEGLCLTTVSDTLPDVSGTMLPVSFRRSEDILYIDIPAKKGGKA